MSSGSASGSAGRDRRGRDVDLEHLTLVDRRAGARSRGRPLDLAVLDQPLNVRARQIRQQGGEEVVEPQPVMLFLDRQCPRPRALHHAARARFAVVFESGLKRLDRMTSMMMLNGTMSIDTNWEVENPPTIPRGSPR